MAVSSSTTPTYSWTAPASPPSPYFYTINISRVSDGSDAWNYDVISPTTTSVVHDVDGNADVPVLVSGILYRFNLSVVDLNGNTAQYSINFTTPIEK